MVTKSPSLVLLLILLLLLPYCHQCKVLQSTALTLNHVQKNTHTIAKDHYTYPNYIIRPHISRYGYKVLIDASIGTPPSKKTFIFDTASPITWTQCTPCTKCFPQTLPLFDPKKSTTYKKMTKNHNLSDFFDDSMEYEARYVFGHYSSGIMSLDTFTFPSHTGSPEILRNFVFGCANNNVGDWPENTPITGIMGMNRSPLSLIGQMGSRAIRRFSYCLPKINSPVKRTVLRFGPDVKIRTGLQCTKFLKIKTNMYDVALEGVSVLGRRLKVPKGTFSGGCQLDTGASGSRIDSRAYKMILDVLSQYFDKFKLKRLTDPIYEGQLCYNKKPGFNSFPNMTWHFKASGLCRGANVQIGGDSLFGHEGNIFCMTMYGLANRSILGAFQMQNYRFVYDLVGGQVLFGSEDCSKDKP
ncbi:hypothetical protein ABFS83_13G057500 [Erythranthe nasuta]